MKTAKAKSSKSASASALIIAVILTSLLAIIGVMFVLIARVDKMATSSISVNKELNFAVEAVIATISQELVLDVPGVVGAEYYDYPGAEDEWLANLEPYDDSGTYKWRRISDIYGGFDANNLQAEIIPDYQKSSDVGDGKSADADGDGVADSKWVKLTDITSNKGKTIYAAVRIVDNGAMLNVNTAYKFDPNEIDPNLIDGSSQLQINLAALSQRGSNGSLAAAANKLQARRCWTEPTDLSLYEQNVVWRYNGPNGDYTPFDISDEMELRNRFLINFPDFDSPVEEVWDNAFQSPNLRTPVALGGNLTDWFYRAQNDVAGPNDIYSYRHIGTIYNMDRIIDPTGKKMLNINDVNNPTYLYSEIIDANLNITNEIAAQITVNLIDFRDNDSTITTHDVNGVTFYGFEQPCIYISEIAHRFLEDSGDPTIVYRSYAVELYKPYSGDKDPCNWQLVIDGTTTIPINNWKGNEQFCVIKNENPSVLPFNIALAAAKQDASTPPEVLTFIGNSVIQLQRPVPVPPGGYVTVDSMQVPAAAPGWLTVDDIPHSIQRDIALHKCIRRLWAVAAEVTNPDLGGNNSYSRSDTNMVQAHPENIPFTNVGEIGKLFRKPAYYPAGGSNADVIGYNGLDREFQVRLNLADPCYQKLFKYLTVFDPNADGIDNDGDFVADNGELKVPGRININTAPWFVLAQLPWMQYGDATAFEKAKAISIDRDSILLGFRNIGELMLVNDMKNLGSDVADNLNSVAPPNKGPDITDDTARDDFEERDLIFTRISNLVTVRSDVFTAYILVRVGKDGPQKRVMAILDRSNVYTPTDKVRVIALHPVPDPR